VGGAKVNLQGLVGLLPSYSHSCRWPAAQVAMDKRRPIAIEVFREPMVEFRLTNQWQPFRSGTSEMSASDCLYAQPAG
jgi:hypothetical protein